MKTTIIEYRVTGHGHFPLDMLRYDNSWPATSEDAATIGDLISGDIPLMHETQVLVMGLRCTDDRWKSFGWYATDHRKIR